MRRRSIKSCRVRSREIIHSPNFSSRHLLKDVRLVLHQAAALGLWTKALDGMPLLLEEGMAVVWESSITQRCSRSSVLRNRIHRDCNEVRLCGEMLSAANRSSQLNGRSAISAWKPSHWQARTSWSG